MRAADIIIKKRGTGNVAGQTLTREEIEFLVKGYTEGAIPDYQMSAFLMAVYFNGMTFEETGFLTDLMLHSGDVIDLHKMDLPGLHGPFVDKHSTGGVGDKISLPLAPIVAAAGVQIPMMSGRGLGHTGGTLDKLESIPGYKTALDRKEFFDTVNKCGISLIGQSGNLAPADKKLYALRDVTATVDSIPLIASSIMSKKLAAGSDCILLDVKTGSGAFMKTREDAAALARSLVDGAKAAGRKAAALITSMDAPAGFAVVIVREDLLGHKSALCPKIWDFATQADKNSMINTPPTYAIYICKLVLDWILNDVGGLENMKKKNEEKAAILYDYLETTDFYRSGVQKDSRSMMNVVFRTGDDELDKKCQAEYAGRLPAPP